MKRYAGVLLSVTSLPSKYGIGCFDQAAYDFVDWLVKAGQRYWQILPLGATSRVCFYLKEMHKMQRRKLLETMTF